MIRLPDILSLLTWAYTQISSKMPIPDAIASLCQSITVFHLGPLSSYLRTGKEEEDRSVMSAAAEDGAPDPIENETIPEQPSPSSSSSSSSSSTSTDGISMASSATQDSDTGASPSSMTHIPLSDPKDVECSPSVNDQGMGMLDALPAPSVPNIDPPDEPVLGVPVFRPIEFSTPLKSNSVAACPTTTTSNIPQLALNGMRRKREYPKPTFCPFFSTSDTEDSDTTKELWRKRIDLARRQDRTTTSSTMEEAELKRKASFIQRMPFIEGVQWGLPSEFDQYLFVMGLQAAEEAREAEAGRRYGAGDGDDSPVSDISDEEGFEGEEEEEGSDYFPEDNAVYAGDDDRLTTYYGHARPKPMRYSGASAIQLPIAQPVFRDDAGNVRGLVPGPQFDDEDEDDDIRAGPMDSVNGAMYF
ncbi:hypothetical protein EST38_g353 [Candolleomyces aberdarensis]|uniref:Uncharacterized protein n=1 Tax=Candolleomyces aberdarensis TaxID=2316362 RepID=A0A4Q2DXV2_9AGAR|nr:hypothetical protein EST38_g353 [Candolleomyces aberdarensis]